MSQSMAVVIRLILYFEILISHQIKGLVLLQELSTYEAAQKRCQSIGSTLAKIDSVEKYEEMKEFFYTQMPSYDIWIGLKLDESSYPPYVYLYEDGTIASYFNWDFAEPDLQDIDRCIRVAKNSFLFRTRNCSNRYHMLCEDKGSHVTLPSTFHTTLLKETVQDTIEPTTSSKAVITTKQRKDAIIHSPSNTTINGNVKPAPCYNVDSKCLCSKYNESTPVIQEALQTKIEKLKKELSLESKSLSKARRKLISAPDKRMSSVFIGAVGGLFMASVFLFVVLGDMINVCKYCLRHFPNQSVNNT